MFSQILTVAEGEATVPLFVDLDGTLIKSDMLLEGALLLLKRKPWHILSMIFWLLWGGKARLKSEIACRVADRLDVEALPFHQEFLTYLQYQADTGRPIYLATAADQRFAKPIARYVGVFTDVFASDGQNNLSGCAKLNAIIEHIGSTSFDYAGNSRDDLPIWAAARKAIIVNPQVGVLGQATKHFDVSQQFEDRPPPWRTWVKGLRLYQWLKNVLLIVPLLTAHAFTFSNLATIVVAFLSFGFLASSTYIINDLLDLFSDRRHPRKCLRPFAAGNISIQAAIAAAVVLLVSGLALAASISSQFLGMALVYLSVTLLYSFWLKTLVLIDVLTLAGLYTLRIIAGAIAINIDVSFWLLAFSMFLFLHLALVKRCSELSAIRKISRTQVSGRDYSVQDYRILSGMGTGAGYVAVLVFALYINSGNIAHQYEQPMILWLICPLLLYWVSRLWMKTSRGEMKDDPILYSLTDRGSWVVFIVAGGAFVAAI